MNKNHKFRNFFEKNSENQRKINFLVFHHIEASDAKSAIDLLEFNEVSSHYLIDSKGEIFLLVDDNDIAYHAGISFFSGSESLNKNSIGIELVNSDVENTKFSKIQLDSLLELSKNLISKYKIEQKNIVGHSDIAYYGSDCEEEFTQEIDCLDRKQDPSHMFDWKYMAENGVSIFPAQEYQGNDDILYEIGDKNAEITKIKQKLANFGYKVTFVNDNYDVQMKNLARAFNRRFNPDQYLLNKNVWWNSSSFLLNQLVRRIAG